MVPLVVGVELRLGGQDLAVPLAWRAEPDGAWVGAGATPDVEAEVRLVPTGGEARRVEAALRWRRPVGLERAALVLAWSGPGPWAVGRDLERGPLLLPVRTGDRKSTRLNSSHLSVSRMPSSA